MSQSTIPNAVQTPDAPSTSLRRIPVWASALILLVVLAAGGWFLWWGWTGGTPGADKVVDIGKINVNNNRPNFRYATQPNFNREGIFPIGANMFRIHGGDYFMTLMPTETTFAPLRLFYGKPDLFPGDSLETLRMGRDIASNPAQAKSFNVTPDQLKQLAAIQQNAGTWLILNDVDLNTLRADWKAYNDAKDDAAKSAASNTLLAAVKEIGARSLDPTRAALTARAAEVRKVFTDGQIANYRHAHGQ